MDREIKISELWNAFDIYLCIQLISLTYIYIYRSVAHFKSISSNSIFLHMYIYISLSISPLLSFLHTLALYTFLHFLSSKNDAPYIGSFSLLPSFLSILSFSIFPSTLSLLLFYVLLLILFVPSACLSFVFYLSFFSLVLRCFCFPGKFVYAKSIFLVKKQ